MINGTNRPIAHRAAVRAAAVAAILLVGMEMIRFFGGAKHLDRGEEMLIALSGGGVYALVWASMAAMTARLMKGIGEAAERQKNSGDPT